MLVWLCVCGGGGGGGGGGRGEGGGGRGEGGEGGGGRGGRGEGGGTLMQFLEDFVGFMEFAVLHLVLDHSGSQYGKSNICSYHLQSTWCAGPCVACLKPSWKLYCMSVERLCTGRTPMSCKR